MSGDERLLKFILKFTIIAVIFLSAIMSGCEEFEIPDDLSDDNNDGGNNGNSFDCPSPVEVDKLEEDFDLMQDELKSYLNDTEYDFSSLSTTFQQGNLTEKGRQMRIDYEEFRKNYIATANKGCDKTDGTSLEGGSAVWLKGYDLIENEIHPEYLLNMPIWSKKRYVYEEPNYWSGETTEYAEYEYHATIDGYRVVTKITASDVGTVQDQWAELAREQGFEKVTYESGEPVGSTVYYTNYYENEYGTILKGIFFQIFGFKVFAGYYAYTELVGTELDYLNSVEFTEDDARELYEYLVYTPR